MAMHNTGGRAAIWPTKLGNNVRYLSDEWKEPDQTTIRIMDGSKRSSTSDSQRWAEVDDSHTACCSKSGVKIEG